MFKFAYFSLGLNTSITTNITLFRQAEITTSCGTGPAANLPPVQGSHISEKDLVDSDRNESNSTSRGLIRLLPCVFWYALCPGFGHADTIAQSFRRTRFTWECYCTCCTYKHWKLASWRAQLFPRACVRPSTREEPPFAAYFTNASISHYTISNHVFLGSSTTVLCLAASLLLVYRLGVGNPVGSLLMFTKNSCLHAAITGKMRRLHIVFHIVRVLWVRENITVGRGHAISTAS